jgi:hypothetical protein
LRANCAILARGTIFTGWANGANRAIFAGCTSRASRTFQTNTICGIYLFVAVHIFIVIRFAIAVGIPATQASNALWPLCAWQAGSAIFTSRAGWASGASCAVLARGAIFTSRAGWAGCAILAGGAIFTSRAGGASGASCAIFTGWADWARGAGCAILAGGAIFTSRASCAIFTGWADWASGAGCAILARGAVFTGWANGANRAIFAGCTSRASRTFQTNAICGIYLFVAVHIFFVIRFAVTVDIPAT